jgi:hypothetical protein
MKMRLVILLCAFASQARSEEISDDKVFAAARSAVLLFSKTPIARGSAH